MIRSLAREQPGTGYQKSLCNCKADGWCWCAQCAQFSTKVLGPLLRSNLSQYIEFNLVPYGNAKQTSKVRASLATKLILALPMDMHVLGSFPLTPSCSAVHLLCADVSKVHWRYASHWRATLVL